MAEKVGSVYIEIQAKMGSLEKDLKQLEARLQTTDQKGQQVSSSMMTMGKLIAGAGITGAVIGLGKAALTAAAQMEQNRVAFTTMLGSADKANKLLQEMTAFAANTPFELPEIQNAGKQLLAFGVESEKIIPTLTRLGDVSAALNIPIGELSDLYGKARVQGTLYAEDLNQLAGRGIPIFTELAKVMNVNANQVKKLGSEGKITFNMMEQAFVNMTAEGSQFGGMMEAQSQTLAGKWSNFGDSLGRVALIIGDKLAPAAKSALDFLNVMLESDSSEFTRQMGGMVKNAELLVKYNKQYGENKMNQSGFKDELLATERLRGIIVPLNATAEERLEIYKKIATSTKEEAENMGLVERSEMANLLMLDQHKNKILEIADAYRKANPNLDPANKDKPGSSGSGKSKADEANKKAYESRLVWLEKEAAMVEEFGSVEMANFISMLNEKSQAYQTFMSGLTNLSGQLSQLVTMNASNQTAEIDNRVTEQMDAIEEKYNLEKELIENSLLTEEEKNAQLKTLDEQRARDEKAAQDKAAKEKRKIAREAAKLQKQLSMFETAVEIPTAAFMAFSSAQVLPFPASAIVGAAMAAAATGLGLAKLKMIQNQPLPALAEGGIVPAVPGGNQFTIGEGGSAEAVIPLNDATLSRLAGMINSAGGGGQSYVKLPPMSDTALFNMIFSASQNGDLFIASRSVVNR